MPYQYSLYRQLRDRLEIDLCKELGLIVGVRPRDSQVSRSSVHSWIAPTSQPQAQNCKLGPEGDAFVNASRAEDMGLKLTFTISSQELKTSTVDRNLMLRLLRRVGL